jgi:H+/Cl- antiporter ClcA
MIWKVFFACALGTFTLAAGVGIFTGNFDDWSGAQIKFGTVEVGNKTTNVLTLLPNGITLAIVGGLLGSLFINVNSRVNEIRKKILTTKWIKPIETAFFGFMSASIFFLIPYFIAKDYCRAVPHVEYVNEDQVLNEAWCE